MEKRPAFDPVRMLAWEVLQRIERSSAFADQILDQTFSRAPDLSPLDRSYISEMVLGSLRWQGRLDALIQSSLQFPEKRVDPRLLQLLRMGAYQVLFMDRVPDSAAVNESVRLARAAFKDARMAGFVNAILRSISRNKGRNTFPSFQHQPVEHITQAFSHPRWLVERWVAEFGPEKARNLCLANNRKPPFTVRTNTLKTSRENLAEQFRASAIASLPTRFSPEGLILGKSLLPTSEGLFQKGLYFVQDEVSQLIPHLLGPRPGDRVLDACAAPGGKSTHLAQLMKDQGEIIALDLHPSKIGLLRENCARLGISIVRPFRTDASRPLPFPPDDVFDRILLDPPCTGLGILHRNPESKWRRKPEDILRLQRLQRDLLENVAVWLKPGGVLVYSTCTMTREENDQVVDVFLNRHPDFTLEDLGAVLPESTRPLIDGRGFLRTYPEMVAAEDYRMDGFFAARLKRDGKLEE
jgi:16S rRNA (cytosine967-C5)-methyltransferase